MTTQQQIHTALEAWLEAQQAATVAAAEWLSLKGIVGGNADERKIAQKSMPEDEYTKHLGLFAEAEKVKLSTAAAAERTEKILNVLRELLPAETAEVNRATAEIADRTAQRYAVLSMAPPARPIIVRQFDPNEPPPF